MENDHLLKKSVFFISLFILLTSNLNCENLSNKQSSRNHGVKGIVTFQGKPIDWAFVYLYVDEDTSYKKQYMGISEATERDGLYTISPKPGKYFLAARKRWNYASTGPLRIGDYQVIYDQNPITVKEDKWLEINLELEEIKSESSINSPKNTGIKGSVSFRSIVKSNYKNMSDSHRCESYPCHSPTLKPTTALGAYVYAYINKDSDLRGPSYFAMTKLDENKNFTLNLPPGEYYITARKRINKNKFGSLKANDLNADYQNNPVKVKINNYTKLEDIVLKKIDPKKLKKIQSGETKPKTQTIIRGIIKDKSGLPKEGVYAFVYHDSQMIGKPLYRSLLTGKNGYYEIFLSQGGNYYVGARNTFGGPLAPGDLVGAYNGTTENILNIKDDEIKENIDIVVEEFY